jgi:hypothetical protein
MQRPHALYRLLVFKLKVRPRPDPKREEDTEWLTHEQIQEECMNESTSWVDAGTGSLGKVYIEILGCDGTY